MEIDYGAFSDAVGIVSDVSIGKVTVNFILQWALLRMRFVFGSRIIKSFTGGIACKELRALSDSWQKI